MFRAGYREEERTGKKLDRHKALAGYRLSRRRTAAKNVLAAVKKRSVGFLVVTGNAFDFVFRSHENRNALVQFFGNDIKHRN